MSEETDEERDRYVRERYEKAIAYYWKASKANKQWYKLTRAATVVFGALVTLITSLTTSSLFEADGTVQYALQLGSPMLAFLLTIIAGFSQSFQWGSTWQGMVITAQQLEKAYDHYQMIPADQRDYAVEVEKVNQFVINETQSFFERVMGGAKPATKNDDDG